MIPFIFVVLVIVATVWLGIYTTRQKGSTADFFVAGRSVSVFWNASAISGEYLSAASFMGIAALVMKNGYDALWYPVGYAAGYLFLLLFIAGPLRRFGAYTIPDFAEGRFNSPAFRKIAVSFVLFIGFFYTMPQMKGAGVTMSAILGWPYFLGILIVGSVITFNVAVGGMKGITVVQAFQYWVKVFAISAPIFVLMAVFGGYTQPINKALTEPKGIPSLQDGPVKIKGKAAAPNNALNFPASTPMLMTFDTDVKFTKIGAARVAKEGEKFSDVFQYVLLVDSQCGSSKPLTELSATERLHFTKGQVIMVRPLAGMIKGDDGSVKPGNVGVKFEFDEPGTVHFSNANVGPTPSPNAPANGKWVAPFGPLTSKHGFPLLYTYSLIIALVCGTAGLPHILVRFYTNPDGKSAKRTTLWVMVMLGAFYVFTPIWGSLGREIIPGLYASNLTDVVVIKLPTMLQNKLLGEILSGVTSAGAFAAFMSTFSGLLVSMSGAFAHDIYGRILKPGASPETRLVAFKVAAVLVGAVSMGLGLLIESFDIAMMVGWAFAIGAASYFPLLLLGSWWRGLTATGAAVGMLGGGLTSLAAIVTSMLLDKKVLDFPVTPLVRSLIEQPAIWGVPLSILLMVGVSLATKKQVPDDIDTKMLRLHAPEALGVSKDYIEG